MKKPSTNVEFLTHYMEWGSPLNQVFVMDAIGKLVDKIIENEAEVLKSMEGSFVYGPAWVKCAKDYKEQYDAFVNREWEPVDRGVAPDVSDWTTEEIFTYLQDIDEIDAMEVIDDWYHCRQDMVEMINDYYK